MSRGLICRLLLGATLSSLATHGWAQLPPQPARQRRGSGVSNNLRWLQFRVVSGRFSISSQLFGRQVSSSTKNNGREEKLSINLSNGIPVFSYELATKDERVVINGTSSDELTVQREPRGMGTGSWLELIQPLRGPLTLSIQQDEDAEIKTVTASSLWLLALAEPDIMQQEMLPIVQMLQPDWKLADLASGLEAALLATAGQSRTAGRKVWGELVERLTNDRFAAREAADRELRGAGVAVMPYLRSLDRRQLSAEQRIRIRRIIDSIDVGIADDSVERIAFWMSWDPQTWFVLLDRSDSATRQIAARQLTMLIEEPLDFDPLADELVRREQLERLRPRFGMPAEAHSAASTAE
ncbi:MAG: hypothetical protein AB7O62_02810 [Pirellulales bacterium]